MYIKLTEDDKAKFHRSVKVSALRIPIKLIQTFIKNNLQHLCNKPVQIANDKEHKLIPFVSLNGSIPETIEAFITSHQIQVQDIEIQKNYEDFSYNEVMKELMPADVEPPQGYETVGHIAHFNLKPEQYIYQYMIGQVLLDKNKQLKTVVNKTEKLHNVYRTPTLELIAGDKDYSTCVPEGGCRFLLDFERVYWCTRLYSERTRILKLIKPNEVILDLFCGIGPFAIRAAKILGCSCIANDLNPECYNYLQKNIVENHVGSKIIPLNMDARKVVQLFYQGAQTLEEYGITQCFDHVYMNLPVLAMDFLDVFRGFLIKACNWDKQLPMIHVYGFIKAQTQSQLLDCVEIRIRQTLPNFTQAQIEHFQIIKNVTAKKKMVCVSFRLNELDAKLNDDEIQTLLKQDDGRVKNDDEDDEDNDEVGEYVDQEPMKKIKLNVE